MTMKKPYIAPPPEKIPRLKTWDGLKNEANILKETEIMAKLFDKTSQLIPLKEPVPPQNTLQNYTAVIPKLKTWDGLANEAKIAYYGEEIAKVKGANRALASGQTDIAERLLGRKLTSQEVLQGHVGGPVGSEQFASNPAHQTFQLNRFLTSKLGPVLKSLTPEQAAWNDPRQKGTIPKRLAPNNADDLEIQQFTNNVPNNLPKPVAMHHVQKQIIDQGEYQIDPSAAIAASAIAHKSAFSAPPTIAQSSDPFHSSSSAQVKLEPVKAESKEDQEDEEAVSPLALPVPSHIPYNWSSIGSKLHAPGTVPKNKLTDEQYAGLLKAAEHYNLQIQQRSMGRPSKSGRIARSDQVSLYDQINSIVYSKVKPTALRITPLMRHDVDDAIPKLEGQGLRKKRKRIDPHIRQDVPIGFYVIDKYRLNKGIVSMAYKNKHKVPNFPNVKVSNELKNAILAILNNTPPDIDDLNESELKYLERLVHCAGLNHVKLGNNLAYHFHRGKTLEDIIPTKDKLKNDFTILTGELDAGSDSRETKKKLKRIIDQMLVKNMISLNNAEKIKDEFNLI